MRVNGTQYNQGSKKIEQINETMAGGGNPTEHVSAESHAPKTKFDSVMPKHKLIGGRRVLKGSRTKNVLTAEEVKT